MRNSYKLFEVAGVELEYMIVKQDSLQVAPVCDLLLKAASPENTIVSELEFGDIGWSNELVNHVVEIKTLAPPEQNRLAGYASVFRDHVNQINRHLDDMGARLMPGAMHPMMDPYTEMQLWPHEYSPVYEKYNELFDCRGHGWANLQSTHINLPFSNDEEFGKLHAAIRFLMPIMPALTASSPWADRSLKGISDYRLAVYENNSARIPEVSGKVIPEPVYSKSDYEKTILQPLYKAISPHDPEGIMQFEWLNSRGAIARFDRGAIEIRILDIQECPEADIEIVVLLCEVLRMLTENKFGNISDLRKWPVDALYQIYASVVQKGEHAAITNSNYLSALGLSGSTMTASEVWVYLYKTSGLKLPAIEHILGQGSLSSRIVAAAGKNPKPEKLFEISEVLCSCLRDGKMFT
ncbi:MAG: glutamate--cysteine ligase [Balneolia bacterium]|nr:glutamate--cysteine ligase [Balneolia bacterium]